MTDNIKERGNSKLALKAGLWYACANFIGKAITFLTTPIFSRMMSVSDYGEFSNFSTWVITLTIIFGAELYNTLNRAYYDFREQFDDYIFTVTVLGGFIISAAYVIFLAEGSIFLKIVRIPGQFIHILFVFILSFFFRLMYYARERVFYRYKTVAFITFISLFIPTVISVIAVYLLPESNHLSARIYGFYIPLAIIGMFCAIPLFKKSMVFKWEYCKYALVLSIPLLVHYLMANLLTSANIMITRNKLGAEEAATISIASSATHILTILFASTSGALTTWLMDNLNLNNVDTVRKGTLLYVKLLALITILAILFAPDLIYLLGGKKYVVAVTFLPGLLFSILIHSIAYVFNIILTYDKNVTNVAICTTVLSMFGVVAKIFLITDYGIMSLIYVNIVIFGIMFSINYLLVRAAGYAKFIFLKGLLSVIVVVGVITMVSSLLFRFPNIRYLITVLFSALCVTMLIIHQNQLKSFKQKLRK